MASNISNSVLNWYVDAEDMLQDVLRYVPYCLEHKSVWSPKLVTILHEVCSQLDSLWFYEAKKSRFVKEEKLNIGNYFEYYGEYVAPKWVVFWGQEPERIQPFKSWDNLPATSYKKEQWKKVFTPEWWEAYQNVKHNRLANENMATLECTVYAVAGLFLAIIRSEDCRDGIAQLGWLSCNGTTNGNPQAWLSEDSPATKRKAIAVESRLFGYAVGWSKETIKRESIWTGCASHRFQQWFNQYESAGEDERM